MVGSRRGSSAGGRSRALVARFDQSGEQDLGFGRKGVLTVRRSDEQSGGRRGLAAFGTAEGLCIRLGTLLRCFDSTGRRDRSYGAGRGFVVLPGSARSLLVDSVGRPIFRQGHRLVRLTSDGQVDDAFGDHGGVALPLQPEGSLGLALGPGDSVVVASAPSGRFARFTSAGILDPSFGEMGIAQIPFGDSGLASLDVASDGSTFAMLRRSGSAEAFEILTKLGPDGSLDPTFGSEGGVPLAGSWADDLATDSRGLSYLRTERGDGLGLVRLDATGKLDSAFGRDGTLRVHFGSRHSYSTALAVLPSDDVVVAGALETKAGGTVLALSVFPTG